MSENRRILHLVKTLEGATWAFHQIGELMKLGWDVHVACPTVTGRHLADLKATGATLHQLPIELPLKRPWQFVVHKNKFRSFVQELRPALIHSHFVSTTLMARIALRGLGIPRLFQVPGPLHLEHQIFGQWDTLSADHDDYWIGSSEFICRLYREKFHVDPERVFKSYYGIKLSEPQGDTFLRQKFGIPQSAFLVGNVSYFYPPKKHLGQKIGIKGHELMLEALPELLKEFPELVMIFIGGPWIGGEAYYEKLRARAELMAPGRIIFAGSMPNAEVLKAWREIDLALHVPLSENCGGVVEPLLANTPVLCSRVGGLPEVINDGETGLLCERSAQMIQDKIRFALTHQREMKAMTQAGHARVLEMFAREKTAAQINALYQKILAL